MGWGKYYVTYKMQGFWRNLNLKADANESGNKQTKNTTFSANIG